MGSAYSCVPAVKITNSYFFPTSFKKLKRPGLVLSIPSLFLSNLKCINVSSKSKTSVNILFPSLIFGK